MDGMGNIRVGVDVAEMRCQVGGGGLEMQIVHKRYWGKRGALGAPRRSPCHLPIMPSGTEYHANKLRSILSLDTPFIFPLFTFPETYVSSGDTTPWSPLQCRLFILPAPGSSGQELGSLSFLVLIAASRPLLLHPLGSEVKHHLRPQRCSPPFFTCTRDFDTHRLPYTLSLPCPPQRLLSSFPVLCFLLEDPVKNPSCSVIELPLPQALSWPCTHHTCSSLYSSLISHGF